MDALRTISYTQAKKFVKGTFVEPVQAPTFELYPENFEKIISIPSETCLTVENAVTFYCDVCKEDVTMEKKLHYQSIAHNFKQGASVSNFGIPATNVGYKMLQKNGWDEESGMGAREQGRILPVPTILKLDKKGLGPNLPKPKITHFSSQPDAGPLTLAAVASVDAAARSYSRVLGKHASSVSRVVGRDSSTVDLHSSDNATIYLANLTKQERRLQARNRNRKIAALEKKVNILAAHSLKDLGR